MTLPELFSLLSTHTLYWREPLWLFLALQPLLLFLFRRLLAQQRLDDYADRSLHPWIIAASNDQPDHWFSFRKLAWVLAWALLAISAAGPRLADEIHGELPAAALDIYIVVDLSRSMQATDVRPGRLRRAKSEIVDLLKLINDSPGKRIGIIVYTGKPYLLSPLTGDHNVLRFYLEQLDSVVLPVSGSLHERALQLAQRELRQSEKRRAVIWVTDGDLGNIDPDSRQPDNAPAFTLQQRIDSLLQDDIALSVMGVGTTEGGAIPLPGGQWLIRDGEAVISRLDENRLQRLINESQGTLKPVYHRVADDNSDWQQLYYEGIARGIPDIADNIDQQKDDAVVWINLMQWSLLPGIFFLCLAIAPFRWLLTKNSNEVHTAKIVLPSVIIMVALSNLTPVDVFAATPQTVTTRPQTDSLSPSSLFTQGDFKTAINAYSQIHGYDGRLGEGASLYRLQNYTAAISQFSLAVLKADTDKQRATALFNLGNSYFKTGQYAAAVNVFSDVLRYQPKDSSALHNLTVSLQLKQQVERRVLQTPGTAFRPGRGPRTARTDRSISMGKSDATLSLTDSSGPQATALPETISDEEIEALIKKGLQHIQLASKGPGGSSSDSNNKPNVDVTWQQQTTQSLEPDIRDDRSKLWKRLFELEEGLDAPAIKPKQLPGINPW